MKILHNPHGLGPCVLVLGTFDGVHRGHQALLMRGGELAEAEGLPLYCCTFDPHPLAVLRREAAPPLLTTLEERAERMADFGVEALCVIPFTPEIAAVPPEDFVRAMAGGYGPRHVICGYNFTFGCRGSGTGETLRQGEEAYGYSTHVVGEVLIGGEAVSSTRIRGLLAAGSIREVNHLLGGAYQLTGPVGDGKHLGRTMGFPTANVQVPPDKALPAFGVYTCFLEAEAEVYPAVVNIGRHPTLPEGGVTVEANALTGHPALYGKTVRLSLLDFLRPERRFDSVEALQGQIQEDAARARALFQQMR